MTDLNGDLFEPILAQHASSSGGGTLYYVCGIAVFAITAVYIVYRRMPSRVRSGPYSSTAGLWQDLCQAHGLAKVEIIAAKQLAEARGLESTALVFVRPDAWDPQTLPEAVAANRGLYAALRERLFGENPPQVAG